MKGFLFALLGHFIILFFPMEKRVNNVNQDKSKKTFSVVEFFPHFRQVPKFANSKFSKAKKIPQLKSIVKKETPIEKRVKEELVTKYSWDNFQPKPSYPPEARRRGWEGEVKFSVDSNLEGYVEKIQMVKSSGWVLLDREAWQTIEKKWRLAPGMNGELVTIVFRLKEMAGDE